jgi:hypothetical protein
MDRKVPVTFVEFFLERTPFVYPSRVYSNTVYKSAHLDYEIRDTTHSAKRSSTHTASVARRQYLDHWVQLTLLCSKGSTR